MILPILSSADPSAAYEAQAAQAAILKAPSAPKKTAETDDYRRADGSVATRQDKAEPKSGSSEDPRFRDLLHQFVGQVLFGQMLKSMRATQEKNPYFHGGRAEEIFQTQLDMVLTDEMTKASAKTLSEPMYRLMKNA